MRTRMPTLRNGNTHKATIGEFALYFTVNVGADGNPREIMNVKYKVDAEGNIADAEARQAEFYLNMWAIAVSMALQHGAELKDVCRKFSHQMAGCGGFTDNDNIRNCKSTIDYCAKWLWATYGNGEPI